MSNSMQPHLSFYDRLDALLERREDLIAAFEAYAEESRSNEVRRIVRGWIAELRYAETTKQVVNNGRLVAWLPWLRVADASRESDTMHRNIMNEIALDEHPSMLGRAMLYPIILISFVLVVFLVLAVIAFPMFRQLFEMFQIRLPLITKSMFAIADLVTRRPWELLPWGVAIALVGLGLRQVIRYGYRHAIGTRFFGSWIAGNSRSLHAMARFSASLAELRRLEAPLPEALRMAGLASQHAFWMRATHRLAQRLEQGFTDVANLPEARCFPKTVMVAISGALPSDVGIRLLREMATLYEERIRSRTRWSNGLVPPIAILAVGILVGLMLIALILPLARLVTVLY